MNKLAFILSLLAGILLFSCGGPELPPGVEEAYAQLPENVDFNQHIKPVLSDKCYICHGPDEAEVKAGLQLHLQELAYAELAQSPGKYAIKPGNLNKSEIVHRILSDDPEILMPSPDSHLSLSDREKALLIKWIEQGAEYKDHWAFTPPEKRSIPEVESEASLVNPIDHFILSRLESEGLGFSQEADKETLLRRVSFDLTGLPPSLDEIEDFLNDDSESAYEKVVDRLLASPHYGEQRAVDWLDVSRYADTHGYTVDRYRDVSAWRDWVISSFNSNMPYDTFLQWQLAGDMMEDPTHEQILATTFNRLHPQNMEGGIVDEEFRVAYVSDRTDVLGEGLMGITMACAKCHDHKYDPISQKNYYELYSFFNNVNESGQISWDFSMPVPSLLLPTKEQEDFLAYINKLVDQDENALELARKEDENLAKKWLTNQEYKNIDPKALPEKLVIHYDFDQFKLFNKLNPAQKGRMRTQFTENEKSHFTEGYSGKGLQMDGDVWLDLDKLGIYRRNEPFSIGIRIYVPKDLENGVIFHKMVGTRLYNYRGYHLNLKDNKIEMLLAHVWPDNALVEETLEDIPKEQWVQLTMTYDGSSRADGLKLYLNGEPMKTRVVIDNLYKDIIFNDYEGSPLDNPEEPGLQIGARWRGKGIGGAIVDDLLVFQKSLSPTEVMQISDPGGLSGILKKPYEDLSEDEQKGLMEYFWSTRSQKFRKSIASLKKTRGVQVDSMDRVKEIMVMKEMEKPRESFVLDRGQYDVYGEQVFPSTPERIFAFPDSLPKNRLGLAKWLVSKDHPLTARVAVNRYWQRMFGTGIVKTAEDFGNQGELPSHPELLDWLALEFMNSGWDVKALHKLMVMSRTYRQSSLSTEELLERDKENRLLARGPSKRLSGEMLRDNVLAASGLLNKTLGGESVRPYQPEGLWKINGAEYEQDKGENLYRRSMYTIWKRSVPHPTIATFDAPDRSICTVRRQETNTPLQALVLLNDPTYIEAARVLGKKMSDFQQTEEGIAKAFKLLTGRAIRAGEQELLSELQKEEYDKFKSNPRKSLGWLNSGAFRISAGDDTALIAANAVVASAIMNLDAMITKR
ncbi:DUF1553 domain-containing protein [Poritiphilus flavus]|uniref:DUF1553 domain-containing protein n=1 Tax=Poritiphilus flavus TaxID=2697053 RepID=A0A6L9EDU6_9FLAO|nr:DUF1553 domain-containing protein [Poritiphilus flavus]NAS12876.1 DUF1553 domain-containing protein [Poritiphilus flavus]